MTHSETTSQPPRQRPGQRPAAAPSAVYQSRAVMIAEKRDDALPIPSHFCYAVQRPATAKQSERARLGAKFSCRPGPFIHHVADPFEVWVFGRSQVRRELELAPLFCVLDEQRNDKIIAIEVPAVGIARTQKSKLQRIIGSSTR